MRRRSEPLLLKLLQVERERLTNEAVQEALHFIDHNECGLAYDVFVHETTVGGVTFSPDGMELLRDAGLALGVSYPRCCFPPFGSE